MANRTSLTKDLLARYNEQRVGGAFDVKKTLKKPGVSIVSGDRFPINGIHERKYTVPDFVAKQIQGVTELTDASDANVSSAPKSKELSIYVKNIDTRKYKG